ncbi:MAG: hypothetical protein WAM17_11300 [Rhodoplanes sp.]
MISCRGIGILTGAPNRQPDLGRHLVFTITYVAEMLGEDEDWLHELSIDMFPEDGCLHVYHGHDDAVTAFTDYGIENLKQIIADMRADGRAPRRTLSTD